MAAAAASRVGAGPLAIGVGATRAYIYNGNLREFPDVADLGPLSDCSVGTGHYVVVVRKEGSNVRCWCGGASGELGTGDLTGAVTVHCGPWVTMALDDCGRVATWHDSPMNMLRDRPGILHSLPPVARLVGSRFIQLALTRSDEVWQWGFWVGEEPERIAAACGYGWRSIQQQMDEGFVGETSDGRLIFFNVLFGHHEREVLQTGEMRFPLRCLAETRHAIAAVDAGGSVWLLNMTPVRGVRGVMHRADFSGRVVQIACTNPICSRNQIASRIVALTECGELWETLDDVTGRNWRSISAAHPELPRGLRPFGGTYADKVILAPDHCGGKDRFALFCRMAARIGVPRDVVCAVLLPFTVHNIYITGPPADPYGVADPHIAPRW
eukprot:TRINITY_DN8860_c1_g1_i1.p1 TRINITY_DN8860_c1_g1~~TRINITY_DN8860_c1_g1_i1.p1  ORF type:complete len:404 (+),score=70.33 TRINITY_DN8860_c1_g1_i1:69-1214(+)